MIIEIVQSTSGAALIIGLLVLLYRIRNRVNAIIHRTIPKSKFPPPPPMNACPQMQMSYSLAIQNAAQPPCYNLAAQNAAAQNTQMQMPAQQSQQTSNPLATLSSSSSLANANSSFQNMHEKWKPSGANNLTGTTTQS